MELERTSNHHAALTRDLPLGPKNGVSNFARHDPMRLPDVHLPRPDATVKTGSQGRERRVHDAATREYSERRWGGARQYQEPTRRPFRERAPEIQVASEPLEEEEPPKADGWGFWGKSLKRKSEKATPPTPAGNDHIRIRPESSFKFRTALQGDIAGFPSSDNTLNSEHSKMRSASLSRPRRFELVCQTVSRDETSSEDAKIWSFVKTAMEPHARKAQVLRSDTSSFTPRRKTTSTREKEINARNLIY
jgi:hypothetical protein